MATRYTDSSETIMQGFMLGIGRPYKIDINGNFFSHFEIFLKNIGKGWSASYLVVSVGDHLHTIACKPS